jgi:hypothetical protein
MTIFMRGEVFPLEYERRKIVIMVPMTACPMVKPERARRGDEDPRELDR